MVGLAPLEGPISELEVLIVDCQTTGATPKLGSVLELGWCLARADDPSREEQAQAHWIALPAGERVSPQVRQLTGFEESVLADALAPAEAWRRLRACLPATHPMPAAIHFARFELTFLRDWSQRFDPGAAFPLDAVCVHAIACRLFPDLPRRNLRALAGFLGHGLHLERRALGHVQATAFIWRKLAQTLSDRGVHSWSELESWLATRNQAPTPRKRAYPIAKARYRELPDQPGVYRLLRSNGDVLYVGKAASLKKRVSSHFSKQRGATERALEMLTQANDVEFTATASALEAALLETELIKSLNPPYNVQLLQGERGAWFSSADFGSTAAKPDELHRFGPLPSRFSVRSLRAVAELIMGEHPSLGRRAAAAGSAQVWAPDETSFAGGWALFGERHALATNCRVAHARQQTLCVARQLLLQLAEARPSQAEDTATETPDLVETLTGWDPERVCRHIERSLANAYQVLRRSSWLCLLANSTVYFREPQGAAGRLLRLEGARIVAAQDSAAVELPAPQPRRARQAVQLAFDAARYDQLRILTTELKRILRDGGDVAVRLSRTRRLSGTQLRSVLRFV
jgi:DNA polymerase III epsilon subunit-like protein